MRFLGPARRDFAIGAVTLAIGLTLDVFYPGFEGEIATFLNKMFSNWGIVLLVIATIGETLPFISLYFPFSVITISALLATNGQIQQVLVIWVFGYIGYVIGLIMTYVLGRLGSRHHGVQSVWTGQFMKYGLAAISPNIVAIVLFGDARNGIPAKQSLFLASVFISIWSMFWFNLIGLAVLASSGGNGVYWIIAIGFFLWGCIKIVREGVSVGSSG